MPSIKSKIFNFLIRNSYIFQGRFKKEVFDFNTSIENFRIRCEQGASKFGKISADVTILEQTVHSIYTEWLMPKVATSDKIIMYVHGGGYVSGSCSDHRGIISKFAEFVQVRTLLYEYRLAPEHPFPAALEDSLTVYNWLISSGYKPENIIIAGESAGGGLCLAILLALKEKNTPLPKAAVAISPWTDLTCSSDSYFTKNKVSPAPLNSWSVFSSYYTGKDIPTNPLISPLYGNLENLPPIYINSAEDDELFEDGKKFYLKAKEAGVNVIFKSGKGMLHCYPLLAPMFKEATDAMNDIAFFIRKHLNIHLQKN